MSSINGRSAPPAIEIKGLSKTFGPSRVLTDFELAIDPGRIQALVGANGSGKSTLIKVISGYHAPDPGGEVQIGGVRLEFGAPPVSYRLGARFVHQDRALIPELSVLDNLLLAGGYSTTWGTVRPRHTARQAREMLRLIGLDVDPAVKLGDLRVAEQTGVALARAIRPDAAHPARILILDEPTATLPVVEVAQMHGMIRAAAGNGIAVLLVTHHLDEIFELAHHVTVLRDGHTAASIAVSKTGRNELVALITGKEPGSPEPEMGRPLAGMRGPHTERVETLVVDDLCGEQLAGVSLSASPGEIVGIAGITGSGRDTLLGSIFGVQAYQRGRVSICGRVIPAGRPDVAMANGVAFLPGNYRLAGGIMSMTARENIGLTNLAPFWNGLILWKRLERAEAAKWFSNVDVRPGDGIENLQSTFSGGNQQKILFAKWMRLGPSVFLLDDPTQGVDVGAKRQLHLRLLDAAREGMTIVVNSTDLEELEAICTRVLLMSNGRVVKELSGRSVTAREINRAIMLGVDESPRRPDDIRVSAPPSLQNGN